MKWSTISGWLRVTLSTLGGPGILLSAFLDSSFLPLPLVTDLIVMDFSMRRPALMPYYAAMAALGSLAGCIWIYALARKAGEAYYRERHQPAPGSVRKWVQEFPLTSVLLPAVAPFPVPFKPFVIAQGVFRVPVVPFVVGTFVGRGVLFFCRGLPRRALRSCRQGICIAPKMGVGRNAAGVDRARSCNSSAIVRPGRRPTRNQLTATCLR